MGTSCPSVISPIMKYLILHKWGKINNVLDVGIGKSGKAAFFTREMFDNTGQQRHFSKPETWKLHIEGIEICKEYHCPMHDYLYDKVYWCDVMEALNQIPCRACDPRFDVIFFMATIEHLDKDLGTQILYKLKGFMNYGGLLVVTTPNGYEVQDATDNNPNDEHKCGWVLEDFKSIEAQYGLKIVYTEVTYSNRLIVIMEKK